jgi:hypothetical protein
MIREERQVFQMLVDITKIERIKLEPGEVLHVKCGSIITEAQVMEIHKVIKERFPNNKAFLSDASVDLTMQAINPNSEENNGN